MGLALPEQAAARHGAQAMAPHGHPWEGVRSSWLRSREVVVLGKTMSARGNLQRNEVGKTLQHPQSTP